jgi:glutamate-1-semialdehyde 2,1-aminomutase
MTDATTLLDKARRVIPGGVNSCRRETTPPLCVRGADGAYIEDVEGRRLIDYHAAFGCILLGHCFPDVAERVAAAARTSSMVGVGVTDAEVELAERLARHVPSVERVLLTNSGGEATYSAVRLARGITGREKIVKFQGCYHGSHDYVLPNTLTIQTKSGTTIDTNASAGMLPAASASVLVARYNDLDSVRSLFTANEGAIAGVIVEPLLHNAATILPEPGFLEGLRELCDTTGAVLIFDEVITGFRHALGGYQSIAGVVPDVTTFAKAMANGFPIGAIGGRAEVMDHFNTARGGDVFYSGTYNGNGIAVAAALATIDVLETQPVYERIYALGEQMRAGLATIVARVGAPATVVGFGSIYGLIFVPGPVLTYEDVRANDVESFLCYKTELLERGVLEMPSGNAMRCHVSYSHTTEDVDRTLAAAEEALDATVAATRAVG